MFEEMGGGERKGTGCRSAITIVLLQIYHHLNHFHAGVFAQSLEVDASAAETQAKQPKLFSPRYTH